MTSIAPLVDKYIYDLLLGTRYESWMGPHPSNQLAVTLLIVCLSFIGSYWLFGRRQRKKQSALRHELLAAQERVEELQMELEAHEAEEMRKHQEENREIRVWMDGAFDMFHFGHMNAFRQGRALGTHLIVGVNDDASIKACKGTAPVLDDDERSGAVKGCRWVDEIVPHAPYVMTPEYLSYVIDKYKIDLVVHGDDPCIVDGKDVYADAKSRGIYREIPRTTGVSTTDIVGRMLLMSRDHHDRARQSPMMGSLMSKSKAAKQGSNSALKSSPSSVVEPAPTANEKPPAPAPVETAVVATSPKAPEPEQPHESTMFVRRTKFLTTGRMIRIFSQQCREPKPNDKIVYIDGAWDMFHVGHVETLRAARALGDFLVVGVHNDDLVNSHRGANYPIMNLNERVLSVLGCRYVDDVLIDAPWEITRDMIAGLGISVVATGTKRDCQEPSSTTGKYYEIPRQLGILKEVESKADITVDAIVERILAQETQYQIKLKKKTKAENEYYSQRFGYDVEGENPEESKAAEEIAPVPALRL